MSLISATAVRVGASALICIASVLASTSAASAHSDLTRSTPADGAEVQVAPAQIELEFDAGVEAGLSSVGVKDASGAAVDKGKPFAVAGSSTKLGVLIDSKSTGKHTATYRVNAADGHVMSGTFSFTVAASQSPAATPAAEEGVLGGAATVDTITTEATDTGEPAAIVPGGSTSSSQKTPIPPAAIALLMVATAIGGIALRRRYS